MTPEQAREVLRAVTEHALTMVQFIYGPAYALRAAELIKEALIVDRAHRNTQPQGE